MKPTDLLSSLNSLETYLQTRVLNGKYWKLKTLVFTLLFSLSFLFVSNHGYITQNFKNFYTDTILKKPQPFFFWNSIVEQGQAPFTPKKHEVGSHESNRIFRLTIPLISRFLHLNGVGLFMLQVLMGILFLYILLSTLEKILSQRIIIFYFFLAFMNVYAGLCFFLNCFGHGDGYTYFFILCSLILRNPFLLTLSLQLSFWCDERSVISVLGVVFFQYFYYQLKSKPVIYLSSIVFVNLLIYVGLRLSLTNTFHLQSTDVEGASIGRFTEMAKYISSWWENRLYVGLEGFIVLIMVTFIIQRREKQYLFLLLSCLYWLPILLITLLVADTVRTISFSFPFFLIALCYLKDRVIISQLKILCLIIAIINIIIPIIFP